MIELSNQTSQNNSDARTELQRYAATLRRRSLRIYSTAPMLAILHYIMLDSEQDSRIHWHALFIGVMLLAMTCAGIAVFVIEFVL